MTKVTDAVIDADLEHLSEIARLHLAAFPDSVLGRLGVEAVRRNYHWQLTGPHDLTALLVVNGGEVQGYLFGGVFRGSTIGFVRKEKWFLVRRVLVSPGVIFHRAGRERVGLAMRLLARRGEPTQVERPDSVPPRSFGVLALGVSPDARGTGVGTLLVAEAVHRAVEAGFERMHLTVHPGNSEAVAFYRRQGWTEIDDESGKWTGQMTRSIPHWGSSDRASAAQSEDRPDDVRRSVRSDGSTSQTKG